MNYKALIFFDKREIFLATVFFLNTTFPTALIISDSAVSKLVFATSLLPAKSSVSTFFTKVLALLLLALLTSAFLLFLLILVLSDFIFALFSFPYFITFFKK